MIYEYKFPTWGLASLRLAYFVNKEMPRNISKKIEKSLPIRYGAQPHIIIYVHIKVMQPFAIIQGLLLSYDQVVSSIHLP